MEFVLRPRAATIKLTHKDGRVDMCTSACHVAEVIKDKYEISLSKFQANRLCNLHLYKRPKFKLPEGITVERLNSTVVTRRNKGIPDDYWSNLLNRAVVTRTS